VSDPRDARPERDLLERRHDEPDPAAVGFVLHLGRALHRAGDSAQGLEERLGAVSDRLGVANHQFFSTPTSIMASFGPIGRQRTHMLRVHPGDVNLDALAALERVSLDVAQGRASPADSVLAISRIEAAPSPYGPGVTALAFGVLSGAATQFFGGGAREVLVATVLGLGVGALALCAAGRPRLGRVFEPVAAFLVSAGAIGLAQVADPVSVLIATLGGLIALLPGLTLTVAMSAWTALVAVVVAGLGFVVVLRAAPGDAPWIVAIGALGVLGGRGGAATLGVELATFAGALAVGLASSAYARWRRRPAAVVQVPGILLLVPGSVGFRGLTSLVDRQAVAGVETMFSMILTAMALVAGLLVAGAVAPEPGPGPGSIADSRPRR
jgi:uncharacterized membrane protein YjjP (DUF1212 family)